MDIFLQQISNSFFLNLPQSWVDWLLFCLWIIILFILIRHFSKGIKLVETNPMDWLFYIFLTFICSSLFRIDLLPFHIQIFPSNMQVGGEFFLIFFQAVPWIAAAVFEKRFLSIILAFLGSMVFSGFYEHTVFFILLMVSLAVFFNYLLSELNPLFSRFRGHPLVMLGLTIVCTFPLFYLEKFAGFESELPLRLDLCFHDGWIFYLSRILELLIGGLTAEILMQGKEKTDKRKLTAERIPEEKKIVFHLVGLFYLVLVGMTVFWNVTRAAALDDWKEEITNRISLLDTSVLSSFTSNAIRINQLSSDVLLSGETLTIRDEIKPLFQPVQNIDQFYLFDAQGELLFSYPQIQEADLLISEQEVRSFQDAVQGDEIQAAFSAFDSNAIFVDVVYPITGKNSQVQAAVIARTDMANNPTFLPLTAQIQAYQEDGLEVTFVNMLLNARIVWQSPAMGNEEPAASVYTASGLEGWGIEMSIAKKAFLEEFASSQFPYLLTALFGALLIGGFYYIKWVNLEKAILSLSTRFSPDGSENGKPQNAVFFPRIVLDFLDVLKGIFKRLDKRQQDTQTLLELWQSYGNQTLFQSTAKKALGAFEEEDSLFLEVLIRKNQEEQVAERFVLSTEKGFEDYSYLDEQIINVLEDQDQLVIGNTSRFHQLIRAIGKPFPQALVITKFSIDEEHSGVFIHAYRSIHEFSKEKIAALNKNMAPFFKQISELVQLQQWLTEKKILASLFEELNYPLFVFIDQKLWYGNKAASAFLKLDSDEGQTSVEKRVVENEIFNIMQRNSSREKAIVAKEMPTGEKYEIEILNSEDPGIGRVSVLLLKDQTREKKQEELTHDFITMLSHDLRSPITILEGYSKMIPMVGKLNPTQQEYLEKIKGGLDTITSLVEGILAEDRIEKGSIIPNIEIPMAGMIRDIVIKLDSLANQKRVKVSLGEMNPELVVLGDAVLLKQAFYNIIHNAIKFSDLDGAVKINLNESKKEITLEVQNSGPGIASLDIPFIFEKYYHPKAGEPGNGKMGGMGLYIAKFIINAHRGNISVESELGKGATFYITLPKNTKSE